MKNTFLPSTNSLNEKTWYLIDAENKTLGRVATQIAQILIGKHKSDYGYHLDTGDYIVVINAEKIIVSGQKAKTKLYYESKYMRPARQRSIGLLCFFVALRHGGVLRPCSTRSRLPWPTRAVRRMQFENATRAFLTPIPDRATGTMSRGRKCNCHSTLLRTRRPSLRFLARFERPSRSGCRQGVTV